MPTIQIFHLGELPYKPTPGQEVHYFYRDRDNIKEFMRRLLALGRDLIILTDIECDEARAPCGCYGYDGVCCWHHGSSDKEFADCLCSRDVKCNYHAR